MLKPSADVSEGEEQREPFDSSNLPDGITAIPVADPDNPSLIVMQVWSGWY